MLEARLELPVYRTRSNNGYPIKKKHVVSNEVKDAISNLAHQGASFLSIKGNVITVKMNGELMIVDVKDSDESN
jgi:hypothetical protein